VQDNFLLGPTRNNGVSHSASAGGNLNGQASTSNPNHNKPDSLVRNCQEMERSVIERALVNCGYSRTHAANALGISRVTLYKKMKKYGLMESPLP
jgi:DNA-binding NtrC family response regulator